ncbi:hypothetical protein LU604_04045 [Erwinia tracheiphila]|nr:hypothetical protein [Erwinia tracheiphila]UIA85598.1 hypothetical protein LU604_04045 [Erwinia tracheiphila]UIA94132.1 hypothetical protein LU632_03995 [Erwinia tracheiphila]
MNTYAYAPNPLNWVDPLGLSKCSASGKCRLLRQLLITVEGVA